MISHEHRCIFVHIPKCGGSSIEAVLWPGPRTAEDLWMGFVSQYNNKYQTGGLQHLCAHQIRQEVGEDAFSSYFKFAVVRNPWDKAVSQYVYMRERPDLRSLVGMEPNDEFKTYLQLIRKRLHVQWQPQHEFILDASGNLLVDSVARYEHLERDASKIFAVLGVPAHLPRVNVSERLPTERYYDREAADMIADMYAYDVRLLGYTSPLEAEGRAEDRVGLSGR
jgi:hypothetical protein